MYGNYKSKLTFEKRLEETNRILSKYPDKIPIICERNLKSTIPIMEKFKFLVPKETTVGQFLYIIRQKIKVPSEMAIFLLCNNNLLRTTSDLGYVYENNKDKDGFLYIVYTGEMTYGGK